MIRIYSNRKPRRSINSFLTCQNLGPKTSELDVPLIIPLHRALHYSLEYLNFGRKRFLFIQMGVHLVLIYI